MPDIGSLPPEPIKDESVSKELFDYMSIPGIKSLIDSTKENENHEDDKIKNAFNLLLYENGKKLELTVKITDRYLAQLMLSSMYGGKFGIPGIEICEIRFADFKHNQSILKYLEEKIVELRDEEINGE